MALEVANLLLILIGCVLLPIQPSTSSPLENETLIELNNRLYRLQLKVESLENEKVELTERFGTFQTEMMTEMEKLALRINDLESENSQQDEEILQLKIHVSNLESILPPKMASYNATNQSSNKNNERPAPIATTPPSSCEELTGYANSADMDGIHFVQNKVTKKIEAVFCHFTTNPISQDFIGHVDVKTETVHFYVQRGSNFGTPNAVIPFEFAPLNEGNAFNLASGIFTVPVAGIYHFQFSAVKDNSVNYLAIYIQVNGVNIGLADTSQNAVLSGSVVSLSASLRLAAGDTVKLYNHGSGVLFDDKNRWTHFSGWLVEENFM